MPSQAEPASPLRVLMRMPDLTPGPAKKAVESPEHEVYEQQPLAPLVSMLPSEPPKPHTTHQPVAPEELRQPNRFARPLTMLAGLALAAVVLVVLTNRFRDRGGAPEPPSDPYVKNVLGGSPTEITKAPEINFPTEGPPAPRPENLAQPANSGPALGADMPALEMDRMRIERLPAVDQQTRFPYTDDASTVQVSDGQPGVARLDRGIEPPKPQAPYDRSRPGLY